MCTGCPPTQQAPLAVTSLSHSLTNNTFAIKDHLLLLRLQSVDLILRGRAMRIHPSSSSAPAASAAGNGGEPGPEAFESGEGADLATEGSSPAAAHVGISCGLQTHLTIAEVRTRTV